MALISCEIEFNRNIILDLSTRVIQKIIQKWIKKIKYKVIFQRIAFEKVDQLKQQKEIFTTLSFKSMEDGEISAL